MRQISQPGNNFNLCSPRKEHSGFSAYLFSGFVHWMLISLLSERWFYSEELPWNRNLLFSLFLWHWRVVYLFSSKSQSCPLWNWQEDLLLQMFSFAAIYWFKASDWFSHVLALVACWKISSLGLLSYDNMQFGSLLQKCFISFYAFKALQITQ